MQSEFHRIKELCSIFLRQIFRSTVIHILKVTQFIFFKEKKNVDFYQKYKYFVDVSSLCDQLFTEVIFS